jgi:oxygen-independent coproporphyrinogen-3 oxidase
LSDLVEWTLEMNPATVSLEKAALLRELGVSRISMGVQAWDAPTLETLGRVHSAEQARHSYAVLREAGFANINLDHIFGVPGQSPEAWVDTLRQTIALQPDHISAYNLTYEEDTEFMRKFQSGEFSQDAEADADLFEQTADLLAAAGYEPYETSNFARPNRRCLHNLAYWRGFDYLGLGPSAFSTVGDRRWSNVRDTAAYTERILAGDFAADFHEPVSAELRRRESIAFGLRTADGVEREWLQPWGPRVDELSSLGLISTVGERVVLTRKGRLLADSVAEEFV